MTMKLTGTDGGTVGARLLRRDRVVHCGHSHSHSITLSARNSSSCGTVSPIAFAVFKLMTSSNFLGCSTGRSPGFAPLRILLT
jgi:hypothetical protein